MKKVKYKLKASYSVEASFIMPLIFLLLFTVIRYAYSLHDSAVADAQAAYAAEEGRMAMLYGRVPFDDSIKKGGFNDSGSREEIKDTIENYMEKSEGFMMFAKASDVGIVLGNSEIKAELMKRDKTGSGIVTDGLFKDVTATAKRKDSRSGRNARITQLVFRAGKKMLDV